MAEYVQFVKIKDSKPLWPKLKDLIRLEWQQTDVMGNLTRHRLRWLKNASVKSREKYGHCLVLKIPSSMLENLFEAL